jgi:ABC-type glutathione transport system ATPase component
MTTAGPKIQIQGLAKSFGVTGRAMPALAEVDLDVAEHELVCLLGPSGCGKSRCSTSWPASWHRRPAPCWWTVAR